jgi:ribosomal protein S12 methylthiotransferase
LLRQLDKIDGLTWIRLLYCYEERISGELIEAIAESGKICRYIDIPLQHASDKILKAMRRRSTRAGIEETLGLLRKNIPDIAIRTTLMTGFPGETDEDFAELCEFVRAQRFERLGVFAFSCEDGTAAADMADQVPRVIAEERRDMLMQIQQEISLEFGQSLVGCGLKVLVDELESEGVYLGRTEWDAPEIDCAVLIEAQGEIAVEIGEFIEVEITDAVDYDLIGRTL